MRTLPFRDPDEVRTAARAAREVVFGGGVVVIPSESFYGLACDPANAEAVARVCALKQRPKDLGLPVVCADWQQLERLVEVPERYRIRLSRLWPAALTAVLRTRRRLPAARTDTLAIRIPGHASLRSLAYRVGALTATSANRHGSAPCSTVEAVLSSLAGAPDLTLDAGPTAGGVASTLVDLTGPEPRILRFGSVPWDDPEVES